MNDFFSQFIQFIQGLNQAPSNQPLSLSLICCIVLSLLISFISLAISWYNAYYKTKAFQADNITKNRLLWISEVRNLIALFIDTYIGYIKKPDEAIELERIAAKIRLYLRSNDADYEALTDALENCIKEGYCEATLNALITAAQNVLNDVWLRVKAETMISKTHGKRIIKQVEAMKELRNK